MISFNSALYITLQFINAKRLIISEHTFHSRLMMLRVSRRTEQLFVLNLYKTIRVHVKFCKRSVVNYKKLTVALNNNGTVCSDKTSGTEK